MKKEINKISEQITRKSPFTRKKPSDTKPEDEKKKDGGSVTNNTPEKESYFKTKEDANAFRKWMSENKPEFRYKNKKLDVTGPDNNSFIRAAWEQYGATYLQQTKKKASDILTNQGQIVASSITTVTTIRDTTPEKTEFDEYISPSYSGVKKWNQPSLYVTPLANEIIRLINLGYRSDYFRRFKNALLTFDTKFTSQSNPQLNEELTKIKNSFLSAIEGKNISTPPASESKKYEPKYLTDINSEIFQYLNPQPLVYVPKTTEQEFENTFSVNASKIGLNYDDLDSSESCTAGLELWVKMFGNETVCPDYQNIENLDSFKSLPKTYSNIPNFWKTYKTKLSNCSRGGYLTGRSTMCGKKPLKNIFDYFHSDQNINLITKKGFIGYDFSPSQQLWEEKRILNTVRKNLVEIKKNRLNEERLEIENRLENLIRSYKLSSKKDSNKIIEGLFYEMIDLEKRKYNREIVMENIESILSVMGSLFGNSQEINESFRDKGIDFILLKLNLSKESKLGKIISEALHEVDLKDVPRLFSDCDFLTKKISLAIPQAYLENLQNKEEIGNDLFGHVQSAVYDIMKSSDLREKLEERISNLVCSITQEMNQKFEDKVTNIKNNILSSE